jgi:glycosyltransferase involved in cell wall biosynthesis
MWVRRMPQRLQSRVRVHASVPRSELLSKLKRARVLIAPSLSDGTPITMLEAMAAGALPLMSPLDSIQEWITDGHNGLLAPALYPDRIAAAVRRALTDDELHSCAQKANREIVAQRADREKLRPQILDYYRSLQSGGR